MRVPIAAAVARVDAELYREKCAACPNKAEAAAKAKVAAPAPLPPHAAERPEDQEVRIWTVRPVTTHQLA